MIYIVTDRRVIKDYELLLDSDITLCKYDRRTKSFPVSKFNDNDIVFCLSAHRAPKGGHQINNSDEKFKSSDKGYARRLMLASGVPIPKTWYNINDSIIPYIARPRHHTYGQNFHQIETQGQHEQLKKIARDGWYYSEMFPVDKEYRVITWGNEVLCSFRKEIAGLSPKEVVQYRNRNRHGHHPSYLRIETITQEQEDICVAAIAALGLDYGGVDIMVDANGNTVVCEVNSAPTIRAFFAEALKEKIKNHRE